MTLMDIDCNIYDLLNIQYFESLWGCVKIFYFLINIMWIWLLLWWMILLIILKNIDRSKSTYKNTNTTKIELDNKINSLIREWIYKDKNQIIELLPPELEEYKENILNSIKPYIKIKVDEINETENTNKLWWIPTNIIYKDYPKDKNWNFMLFLGQIDFSTISQLMNYPSEWILQFYISTNNLYWLNFDNQESSDIVVKYFDNHEQIIKLNDDEVEIIMKNIQWVNNIPFSHYPVVFKLEFKESFMIPTCYDTLEFQNIWIENEDHIELFMEFAQNIYWNTPHHQIWWIPYFTQSEIRSNTDQILLFQIDSQQNKKWEWDIIRWDVWVMNFFINKTDLKNKRFNKILYNRDCS